MLRIVPPSDPIQTDNLVVTIFGQPGIGKSTLAFQAPKPLLLDFDGGAQRAAGRKDIVRVYKWADVADITATDVAPFQTIVIDTVGRALEFLAAHLIEADPKNARKSGELTMQGYGALKTAFASWLSRVRTFGKHVVLVAHEKEERDGDNTTVRVDAMGSTRIEVIRLSDLVGFVSAQGGKRTLDFNPTDRHTGKNCAGFDILDIPHIAQSPNWFGDILGEALSRMNAMSEEQRAKLAEAQRWMSSIAELATADQVNGIIPTLPADPLIKGAVAKRARALGLVWTGKEFAMPQGATDAAA